MATRMLLTFRGVFYGLAALLLIRVLFPMANRWQPNAELTKAILILLGSFALIEGTIWLVRQERS